MKKFFNDLFVFLAEVVACKREHRRMQYDTNSWMYKNVQGWLAAHKTETINNGCQFFWIAVYSYPVLRVVREPFWAGYVAFVMPMVLIGTFLAAILMGEFWKWLTILIGIAVVTPFVAIGITKIPTPKWMERASQEADTTPTKSLRQIWREGDTWVKIIVAFAVPIKILVTVAVYTVFGIPVLLVYGYFFAKQKYCPLLANPVKQRS